MTSTATVMGASMSSAMGGPRPYRSPNVPAMSTPTTLPLTPISVVIPLARANGITTLIGGSGSVVGVLIAGTFGDRYGLGPPIALLMLAPITVAVLVITVY